MEVSDDLIARVEHLLSIHERVVIGIAGCPGAGKSTLADSIVERIDSTGRMAARLPMDGFHLADAELDRIGRRNAKGAIDTFDSYGYLSTLRRLDSEREHTIYVPEFERVLEQPIAASIAIPADTRLIVTEGNYLLDLQEPWSNVRKELTEAWYCEVDHALRQAWLLERHVRYGKSPEAAMRWIEEVDDQNARRIEARRGDADLIVHLDVEAAW